MKQPTSPFGFYNPLTKKVIDYNALERLAQKPRVPQNVGVIDIEHHKKVGSIPILMALQKYRP